MGCVKRCATTGGMLLSQLASKLAAGGVSAAKIAIVNDVAGQNYGKAKQVGG